MPAQKTVVAVVGTACSVYSSCSAIVVYKLIVVLACGAGCIVDTDFAVTGAFIAGEGGSVEVEVLWFALVANCEIVA